MPAVQTTVGRYMAMSRYPIGHKVIDARRQFAAVDHYRTREAAEYAARLLNEGRAEVHPHACIGCRVMPV